MSPKAILHPLGKNGPVVPAIGFGLMGMSHTTYGSIPGDVERFALLDRALEQGQTFWDSSDLYGDNEELLGKWFRRTGKRDQIFLATKFGFVQKPGNPYGVDSSAAHCKEACAASLARLGIETIDLYYVHAVNRDTPIEETMRALVELKNEGKIKYIGLSGVSSATLRRAVKIGPVSAVQTEYNPWTREIEQASGTHLLATCRELGVAVVINSPLGRGLLTTKFSSGEALGDETDMRTKVMPRFVDGNREKNIQIVTKFKAIADRKGCTVAQLALAWLLKQGDDIFPIPGTKKMKYLEENWGANEVHLTDAEEAEIRGLAEGNEFAGWVVPDAFKDYVFRDTKEESA